MYEIPNMRICIKCKEVICGFFLKFFKMVDEYMFEKSIYIFRLEQLNNMLHNQNVLNSKCMIDVL